LVFIGFGEYEICLGGIFFIVLIAFEGKSWGENAIEDEVTFPYVCYLLGKIRWNEHQVALCDFSFLQTLDDNFPYPLTIK
jgi:hypothetical protein